MVSSRTVKEWGVFAGLIVVIDYTVVLPVLFVCLVMHYAYYMIQNNPSLVAPDKRAELFYVRWLKEKFPALRQYGINEDKSPPPPPSST